MAGLYSDLDDFIEGGGRDEELPEENVENEGNIPEGEPETPSPQNEGNIESADPEPSTPQKSGNIKSEESQPESPQRNQNITPEENQPENPQRSENIKSKEAQPESPNKSQNINPEESQPENPQRSGNIKSEESQPESPQRNQNITPEENQPESPQRSGNIQSESSEESEPERNSIPISENAPEPPQRRGNIEPRGLQNEPDREGISPQEDNQPSNPQKTGNIPSREKNAPQNPNRVEIEPDEEAAPSETQKGSREARSDSTPESPDRRIINLREEAQPQIPTRSGNIQAEESSPSEPSKRGNIKTDEEPPTTEPAEDTNIEVKTENQPPEDQQSGNIKVNDQPPSLTSKEGNIRLREEVSPTEPNKAGNIQSEESSPDEPQREENIKASEERRPGEISQKGNITPTENPSPSEPNRTGNISPEENARPGQVQRSGNIESEESKPEPTEKKSNITVEDDQPEESQNEGNISPTEESEPSEPNRNENITPPEEPQPSSPDNDGSISPTEESEPQEPDQDGFISPTEESEPKEPQKEGNIDPSNQETTDGTGTEPLSEPQKEGNISPKNKENTDGVGGERLSEPQREGNIDPEDEETTDGIAGEELNREQPLKFQSDKFSSQIDPEDTEFVDAVSGSEDGVPEWQPPLRYQPKEFAEEIKQQETKFVDTVAGKGDGTPEWQPPLRHQPERFAGQIKQEGKFVAVISGKGDGTPERFPPLRHQPKRFAGQIDPTSARFTDEVAAEFVGSNDEAAEWEVPLRHLSKRYADQINPEHEGGLYLDSKFVAGSNEPGDNVRNMEYDKGGSSSELRHQIAVKNALNNGTIDPNFEGGFYYGDAGSLIVVGGDEPGDQIFRFGDSNDSSVEASFNAESSHPSNTNGPILKGVPPAEQADPKQIQFIKKNIENSVLTGSGENRKFPDDNETREHNEPLEFQKEEIRQKLKNGTLINPSDEGGRYILENFVLGSNEPGDQILNFGSIGDPSEESSFNAESSHPTNDNGPILKNVPPSEQADPKQIQFIKKNIENSVIVGSGEDRKFPDDNDLKEALEDREFQTGKALQGLKTTDGSERGVLIDPNFEGGIRGDGDSVVGGNEPGDDIRNMKYDKSGSSSKLRHQIAVKSALNNGIIDPNFEGGSYYGKAGERIVLGGNEPGDQILRFGSTSDRSEESSFNAESSHPSNDNGPVLKNVPPADQADPKQIQFIRKNIENSVIIGSGEDRKFPDDNDVKEALEDREFQVGKVLQGLKPTDGSERGVLIDPNFEGGIRGDGDSVVGGNEPGDQILNFGSIGNPSEESSFNAESSHPSNTNGPILKGVPPSEQADPKQVQFIRKNIENSVLTGSGENRGFPDDNDVKEALKDREFQVGKVLQGLKPTESSEGPVLIDPSFEGGRYTSENYVLGSNEPGDQILQFGSASDRSEESSFNAESSHPSNTNGPVLENVPPADQADPKQVQFIRKNIENSVIIGSGENRKFPDDNDVKEALEDREFQVGKVLQGLKPTESSDREVLIDPSFEGGIRGDGNFILGTPENDSDFKNFGVPSDPESESAFNVESSHASNTRGPILPTSTGKPKPLETVFQNNQVSDLERGSEPGENLAEFPDAPFGSATRNDSQSVLLSGRNSGAPKEEEFESQNTRVRLSEFESLFEATGDAGFNPGLFAEPFIQRKPPAGGGNTVRANIKQVDSRTAPIGARILATERITKFTATAKGIVYNAKQFFLQKQNPRKRTQIYNPSAPVETAAYGMLERPGQRVKRHLDEGGFGSAVTSALSVSLPSSARYEDEIEEERVSTPYGDITGSLAFQTPVAQEEPPEVRGSEAITTFKTLEAGNIVKVKQLYSTSNLENLGIFSASQSAVQGFTGSGYLFTNTYDPGTGQSRTDNYHPGAPYLTNIDSANHRPLSNNASFVPADISTIPDGADTNSVLLRLNQASRGASRATFPYVNPTRTPSTDDVIDGDGNIRSAIQNDTDDEAYYENRTFTDKRIPVHRGAESKSYGLPNYSITDSEGKKQKRIDLINRLEPIIGESADPAQEEFGKGSYKDLIPFKFYDIENKGLIVFRAFLESISDNLSPEWSQVNYAGRPEKGHTYGGYSNTISFSFKVAPMSEEEFEAIWKKVNYLKGLTTPSSYSKPEGGTGSYMVPPFMRLTIGDMFNDVYGYMNSLTIGLEDGTDWEIGEDVGRLPKVLSIDVDWQVIEKRAPVALQKYYDAPFIDPVEEVVRESAGSEPEYTLQSSDSPVEAPDVDQGRAIEKANEEPPGPIDSPAEQASTLGPNELNLPELDDLLS